MSNQGMLPPEPPKQFLLHQQNEMLVKRVAELKDSLEVAQAKVEQLQEEIEAYQVEFALRAKEGVA